MTALGINFPEHLHTRLAAAVQRARFLTLDSSTWGIAHRLRVTKQYLMPMYEYGAPLVEVWRQECTEHQQQFEQATTQHKDLIAWITNTHSTRHHVSVNLLGLTSLSARFQHLRTAFQAVLMQQSVTNPLRQLLSHMGPPSTLNRFIYGLRWDHEWQHFLQTNDSIAPIKSALGRHLQGLRRQTIVQDAQ